MNLRWLYITIGIMLIIDFPLAIYLYHKSGYVRPYIYEPVYGESGKAVLGIYAFTALFGIYLIIISIKNKNGN
ncbi:MAG: hypothetical protein COV46_08455 [Deltaproteobacteria bacterium CG11_big_fil_rev_8_21_14_0_20_49_13]|nr:MAG: hypothetical protein COV46_08455 [Deltaproteobacteria bacterium CG11_big_fil_rev_8_21_14_0_20_49_13]